MAPIQGGYNCEKPPGGQLPQIVVWNGVSNVEGIKSYFLSQADTIAAEFGITEDELKNGDYKLLLEPFVYLRYENKYYVMTAHEAALFDAHTGRKLFNHMGDLTHKNLPFAMFLERDEDVLGIKKYNGGTGSHVSNDTIRNQLGIGVVSYSDEELEETSDEPLGEIELFYDQLEKIVEFDIGKATASPKLPTDPYKYDVKWTDDPITYTINIKNLDTAAYKDFTAVVDVNGKKHNGTGDNIVITDSSSSDKTKIVVSTKITTTIKRDYATYQTDYPPSENYGIDGTPKSHGQIEATGKASRKYKYNSHPYDTKTITYTDSYWENGKKYSETVTETVEVPCIHDNNFGWSHEDTNTVADKKEIVIGIYNGMETVPPPMFYEQIRNNNYVELTPSNQSFRKKIEWVSKPIELEVVRFMHKRLKSTAPSFNDGKIEDGSQLPYKGKYTREFIEQNYADIKWTASEGGRMSTAYKGDRDKAKNRDYKIRGDEVRAVFASDVAFNRDQAYNDIRSGYYFNPAGIYSFEVETEVYKDWLPSSNTPTPEHAAIVKALLESFYYESNMVYINPSREAVTITGQTVRINGTTYAPAKDTVGINTFNGFGNYGNEPAPLHEPSQLFKIHAINDGYTREYENELDHAYPSDPTKPDSLTDAKFKRVMEGHKESNTTNTKNYIEYVHEDEVVYQIKETTKVTIRVNPENVKVYTHAQLRNGNHYSIGAYVDEIDIGGVYYEDDGEEYPLTGDSFSPLLSGAQLDEIRIRVFGSMYDDIW